MNPYNQEYYFIQENQEINNLPFLGADTNTVYRKFEYEEQLQGSAPLVFDNVWKDDYRQEGLAVMDPLPKILFCGNDILVATDIHQELLKLNIPNLSTHPSIYIHDDGKRHEDYWFCTFTQRFDCWDRETSKYRKRSTSDWMDESEVPYGIVEYSLNAPLLDKIPLDQRLLFKMGASSDAMITCHESIKHLFETEGSILVPVAEW